MDQAPTKNSTTTSEPVAQSPPNYILSVGKFIDIALLLAGIICASIKLQTPETETCTPTVILSLFTSAAILTSVIVYFSDFSSEYILFTFATFALAAVLSTGSSILIRMRYYA